MVAVRHLGFLSLKFQLPVRFWRADMHHQAKCGADRSNHCQDMAVFPFFQDGGHPPCWIRVTRVCTTHETLLMVLIAVQNLVVSNVVVLKICDFFNILRIRLENAYSRSFLGCFLR